MKEIGWYGGEALADGGMKESRCYEGKMFVRLLSGRDVGIRETRWYERDTFQWYEERQW